MEFDKTTARLQIEREEDWRTWMDKIPAIQFDAGWQVKVIPPVSRAMVRFLVLKDKTQVSIYLDCYDVLGCVGHPYWEVYPVDGDARRCDMNDTKQLLALIRQSLSEARNDNH